MLQGEITRFNIEGPILITLKSFQDSRGFFVERFNLKSMSEIGLGGPYVQDNFSRSAPSVLRGFHYQFDRPQGKLVSCLHGEIFDVIVDLRRKSPTYGQTISVILKGTEPQIFWIPEGFAHGFCVIGNETADITYKVNEYYSSKGEGCICWNDPELKIDWPIEKPILSVKDAAGSSFSDFKIKNQSFSWF